MLFKLSIRVFNFALSDFEILEFHAVHVGWVKSEMA
jgi:hypothetical protein